MKEIQISDFKAHCLSILRDITDAIVVSSRGKKLVVVLPYTDSPGKKQLGVGAGMSITGDILDTSEFWTDWEK